MDDGVTGCALERPIGAGRRHFVLWSPRRRLPFGGGGGWLVSAATMSIAKRAAETGIPMKVAAIAGDVVIHRDVRTRHVWRAWTARDMADATDTMQVF